MYTNSDGYKENIWNMIKDASQIHVLQLDRDVKMITEPFVKRIRFWQNLNLDDMKPFVLI